MPLVLQRRDVEILKYAFAYRVVTYNQIRRKYFARNDESTARRRIRLLCKEGYLRASFVCTHDKSIKCVSATEKAWKMIRESWPFEVDNPYFKSESPDHDIRLAEVLLCVEKLSSFQSFMTENLLQSTSALQENQLYRDLAILQADGALLLNGPDGRQYLYGIELELSKKTPERYQEKIRSYYQVSGVDGVIYICATQELMGLIARADRDVRTTPESIVFLGLERSVLESKEKIYFKNVEQKGIGFF